MNQDYLNSVKAIVDGGIVPLNEIFDYNNDPLFDVYDELFKLAFEHLKDKQKMLGFPPTFFYYDRDCSTNAAATSSKNWKIIGVNVGAIENMFNFFELQSPILEIIEYESLGSLIARTGNPTYVTIYQLYTLFIFYHEYAHLVQKSPGSISHLDEKVNLTIEDGKVLDSHCIEFDADWLGASNLAHSIVQFMGVSETRRAGSPDELGDLVSMGIAAVYCFFLKGAGYYQGLYFMKNAHPHPYVRITYITQIIIETVSINLPEGLFLDQSAVLRKGMKLAEDLLTEDLGNPVNDFAQVWMQSINQIDAYIKLIINAVEKRPELCRNLPNDRL